MSAPTASDNGRRFRPLVLFYHAVSESWDDELAVTPTAFESQVRSALRRGYVPASARDLLDGSKKLMHVTFDDGLCNIRGAISLLTSLRVPATVFVCPGYADDGRPFDVGRLAHLDSAEERETMKWEELRELSELGVEVGSHTTTHAHLTQLSDAELRVSYPARRNASKTSSGAHAPSSRTRSANTTRVSALLRRLPVSPPPLPPREVRRVRPLCAAARRALPARYAPASRAQDVAARAVDRRPAVAASLTPVTAAALCAAPGCARAVPQGLLDRQIFHARSPQRRRSKRRQPILSGCVNRSAAASRSARSSSVAHPIHHDTRKPAAWSARLTQRCRNQEYAGVLV